MKKDGTKLRTLEDIFGYGASGSTPGETELATSYVMRYSRDEADAWLLLDALGLDRG